MKKYSKWKKYIFLNWILSAFVITALTGCRQSEGEADQTREETAVSESQTDEGKAADPEVWTDEAQTTGISGESALDAQIDFNALKEENPDIFAWIHIPGTEIDDPVLQSEQSDDFYESHNAYGQEDDAGAVYIELANLTNMCDFNTVLHGKTGAEGEGVFADLYRFADPDFFREHENIYLYLDGNVLTYEIFAAYERENTSLLRNYDFTYLDGCTQFLDDLYSIRDMTMNLREGWEGVTPYHFLITLTTQKEEKPDDQFVVVAILTQDAAGTIDRVVAE